MFLRVSVAFKNFGRETGSDSYKTFFIFFIFNDNVTPKIPLKSGTKTSPWTQRDKHDPALSRKMFLVKEYRTTSVSTPA